MTMVDTSKSFEPVEIVSGKRTPRKQSFTEKSGHSAFEAALSKSQEEDSHWEAGLHAKGEPHAESRVSTTVSQETHEAPATGTRESGKPVQDLSGLDGRLPPSADDAEASTEQLASALEEPVLTEDATREVNESGLSDAGEFLLDEEHWSQSADEPAADVPSEELTATDAPNDVATDDGGHASEDLSEEFQSEQRVESDAEADITFEASRARAAAPVLESPAIVTSESPSTGAAPPTFVENFGRQAFARSTQLHRAQSAAPASLDMNELVEQITKVRGSMGTGRARVVIGEGNDRVALTVLVRNGTVNIDASVADVGMAQSLERGTAELSEALAKHGLSLGSMETGDSKGETFGQPEQPTGHPPGIPAEPVLEPGSQPQRLQRGVRVVA